MGLHNFQFPFVPFILSGEKTHAIRSVRKHPDKLGDTPNLYRRLRTKKAKLGSGVISAVALPFDAPRIGGAEPSSLSANISRLLQPDSASAVPLALPLANFLSLLLPRYSSTPNFVPLEYLVSSRGAAAASQTCCCNCLTEPGNSTLTPERLGNRTSSQFKQTFPTRDPSN
jgi:hypothetical protein